MKRLSNNKNNRALRVRRHNRVRAIVSGTAEKPRLSVFRSLRGMVAQLVNDEAGKTLCYASSKELKEKKGKVSVAEALGKLIAEKAKTKGIVQIVFDRGGYKYHGRVKALAEGARAGGLEF
jgi:large subunit ribosomal protein L18